MMNTIHETYAQDEKDIQKRHRYDQKRHRYDQKRPNYLNTHDEHDRRDLCTRRKRYTYDKSEKDIRMTKETRVWPKRDVCLTKEPDRCDKRN